jgi:arsenite oxidase large subunit
LQAPGKEDERKKFPFLVNNGRANVNWQNGYLDQDNEFVIDRSPYPFIQMNPKDMDDLKLKAGDLVEVYNDNGSTQAMAYPTPTPKAQADVHAVRAGERRAGECRVARGERIHHPEFQTDLG